MWQTDRRTNGRTDVLPRHSPRCAYASCSKTLAIAVVVCSRERTKLPYLIRWILWTSLGLIIRLPDLTWLDLELRASLQVVGFWCYLSHTHRPEPIVRSQWATRDDWSTQRIFEVPRGTTVNHCDSRVAVNTSKWRRGLLHKLFSNESIWHVSAIKRAQSIEYKGHQKPMKPGSSRTAADTIPSIKVSSK